MKSKSYVVKLGGSLLSHPRLGPGLRAYLESLSPARICLVPGGGELVECLRRFDRIHGLGEEASHWLALEAMAVSAALVARLIDSPSWGSRLEIPDALEFAREDDGQPGALPHSWDVTSDSIAARMAAATSAERLILLKSIDVPAGTPWPEAAARRWVDTFFPQAITGAQFTIEVVNFASYLDSFLL